MAIGDAGRPTCYLNVKESNQIKAQLVVADTCCEDVIFGDDKNVSEHSLIVRILVPAK